MLLLDSNFYLLLRKKKAFSELQFNIYKGITRVGMHYYLSV